MSRKLQLSPFTERARAEKHRTQSRAARARNLRRIYRPKSQPAEASNPKSQ